MGFGWWSRTSVRGVCRKCHPALGLVAEAGFLTHERWRDPSLAESYALCVGRANMEPARFLSLVL